MQQYFPYDLLGRMSLHECDQCKIGLSFIVEMPFRLRPTRSGFLNHVSSISAHPTFRAELTDRCRPKAMKPGIWVMRGPLEDLGPLCLSDDE